MSKNNMEAQNLKGFPEVSEAEMRKTVTEYINYITKTRTDTLNAIFDPEIIACDPETPSVTICFPITENMQNTSGMAHGGVITTAFDITMGMMSRGFQHGRRSPTLTMTIDFIKPVKAGKGFLVTVKPVAIAKHTIDYEAIGTVSDEPDVIVNRCTGKFFIYDAIDEKFFTK